VTAVRTPDLVRLGRPIGKLRERGTNCTLQQLRFRDATRIHASPAEPHLALAQDLRASARRCSSPPAPSAALRTPHGIRKQKYADRVFVLVRQGPRETQAVYARSLPYGASLRISNVELIVASAMRVALQVFS